MKFLKLVAALSCLSFIPSIAGPASASTNGLVLSQVYGGGGNSGATYKNDFIEVFNAGSSAISLNGYSVQYAAATGTSWQVTTLGATTLAPGQYYLVQEAAGTGGTANLPTPDATGTLNLSGTAGKVALVSSTTALTGASPSGATVVDLVGFGTTANGYEGSGPTPAPSNTTAVLRAANGCTDTNNNASDFSTAAPAPRNSASATNSCTPSAVPSASLAVSPTSFPENGGSATVTATLSVAASAQVTISLAFSGTATNGTDYSASSSTITIPAGATSGTITLSAIDDNVYEGNETIITSISSTSANATAGSPNSATTTIVDDDPQPPPTIGARIYQIQGASHVSPMSGMSVTNVPGIVTAVIATGTSQGFYMQDGDGDGNVNTSDGIFVFFGSTAVPSSVVVGGEVTVSGTVSEFRNNIATNLTITEIVSPSVTYAVAAGAGTLFTTNSITPTVIGSGGRLPPTEVIDSESTGSVENRSPANAFDPAHNGIDFYESLEGMLVRINNPVATDRTPAGTGAATLWVVTDSGAYATGINARGGISLTANASNIVDYNPEHIEIYTKLPGTNPGSSFSLNVGDQLASFNGVMDYFGGNYEIYPTTTPVITTPASTVRGVSSIAVGGNRLSVGGYNVENLTVSDPQSKFNGLAADIVTAMGAPDIVSISEVQDNNGTTDAGVVACDQTMAKLLAAINAAAGPAYNYDYRQIDPVDNQDGGAPVGNIRVVQIFNTQRVSFDDKPAPGGTNLSTTPVTITTDANGKPTISFSPGRIDPANRAWANGNVTQPDGSTVGYSATRKPLVGEYTFNGRRVLVVSNHFTSRLADDPLFGVDQPPLLVSQTQRNEQALVVHNFVRDVLAIDANARVVVLGDFNEYDFGPPLRILRNGPLQANGADGSELVLKNLSSELITNPVERYSYVFNGNSQELDHIFVSPGLLTNATATAYQPVHLNAGYGTQNSDHDPIVSSFVLAPNVAPTANAGGNRTVTGGAVVTLSGSGTDSDGTIASYAWTQTSGAPVTLTGANTATASFTAPTGAGALSFTLTVTDNDGASGTDTAMITVAADTSPDAFAFAATTGVEPSSVQTSNAQTISGINTATPISVTGGSYSLNGGAFTTAAGTITNGQSVSVQLTASSKFSTTMQAVLTVGDGSATYAVTTRAAQTTPAPFSFAPVSGAPPGALVSSGSIIVMGIEAPTAISVSGGQFCINANPCTAMAGAVVNNGDSVRVQQTASSAFSTTTTTTLSIGGVNGSFAVTTLAADTSPDTFAFTAASNVPRQTAVTSNAVTITGINTAAAISVANGSYSINGGPFTTAVGTVMAGDSVRVQGVALLDSQATTQVTLMVGDKSATFAITTALSVDTPGGGAVNPLWLLPLVVLRRLRKKPRAS